MNCVHSINTGVAALSLAALFQKGRINQLDKETDMTCGGLTFERL